MAGWHHQLNEREPEQTPEDSEGHFRMALGSSAWKKPLRTMASNGSVMLSCFVQETRKRAMP